jgi:hypothetical protein
MDDDMIRQDELELRMDISRRIRAIEPLAERLFLIDWPNGG